MFLLRLTVHPWPPLLAVKLLLRRKCVRVASANQAASAAAVTRFPAKTVSVKLAAAKFAKTSQASKWLPVRVAIASRTASAAAVIRLLAKTVSVKHVAAKRAQTNRK